MAEPRRNQSSPDRAAVLRARRRRRRLALTVLYSLAALAFSCTLLLLLPDAWPEMPFPQAGGLVVVSITGAVFGLLIGLWRAGFLAATLLPVGALLATGGIYSGVVALLVAGPFALAGLLVGIGCTRTLRRLAARASRLRARRSSASTPAHRAA